jgi:hypothetical protein
VGGYVNWQRGQDLSIVIERMIDHVTNLGFQRQGKRKLSESVIPSLRNFVGKTCNP